MLSAVGSEAFKSARSANNLPVSDPAAYGKIRLMRQSLSYLYLCSGLAICAIEVWDRVAQMAKRRPPRTSPSPRFARPSQREGD